MSAPNRGRRVALIVGVLVLVAAAVAASVWIPRARTRMAEERAACESCHADAGDHLDGHEELACQACHVVPEGARLPLAVGEIFGDDTPPPHGRTTGGPCKSCHEADDAAWRRQMQTAGHRIHVGEGVACTSCHGGAIHGGPTRPECTRCHGNVPTHVELGDGDCALCHGFSDREESAPQSEAPSATLVEIAPWTASIGVDRVHGAGDCRSCHNPHESPRAEADCLGCHRGVLAASVASGPEGHRDCASCHGPHPPRDQPAVQCLTCHRPPPPGQRPSRPTESAWTTIGDPDAGLDVDPSTLTHDARCGTCHTPHVFTADRDGCPRCHAEMETSLARVEGHGECLGCHEPHSPPPDAGTCASCHRAVGHTRPPAAHRSCLACHGAHSGAPELLATCTRCHTEVQSQLATGPEPHQSCDGCHRRPHGDPLRGATTSCVDCHGAEARTATSHASPPAHRACASCHTAHSFSDVPSCERCHAAQQRQSATWPARTVHTGPCVGCHRPHESARIPACRSCHEEQNNRQHTGRHRDCGTCHQVHQAYPSSGGWWGTCASCHTEQGRAARGAPGAHAECRSCHEPVGRRPPTCTSCHETITETLMHQIPDHQECSDCHRGHSVAAPRRDACIGCHEDQATGHFPEASACQSCHPFAR